MYTIRNVGFLVATDSSPSALLMGINLGQKRFLYLQVLSSLSLTRLVLCLLSSNVVCGSLRRASPALGYNTFSILLTIFFLVLLKANNMHLYHHLKSLMEKKSTLLTFYILSYHMFLKVTACGFGGAKILL